MLRSMLCVVVALFLVSDVALAKGKGSKGPKPVIGTIKSIDKDKLTVTVTTKGNKKKPGEDKDFTIPDSVTVTLAAADGTTKDLPVKDALKDAAVAVGASIKVTSDATGTVTKVEVGGDYSHKKKKKAA